MPARLNGSPRQAVFPDGEKVTLSPDQDPRVVFADWLRDRDRSLPGTS